MATGPSVGLPLFGAQCWDYSNLGANTLLDAYVEFMRRTSAKVKLELGFPQMEPQFMSVTVGEQARTWVWESMGSIGDLFMDSYDNEF